MAEKYPVIILTAREGGPLGTSPKTPEDNHRLRSMAEGEYAVVPVAKLETLQGDLEEALQKNAGWVERCKRFREKDATEHKLEVTKVRDALSSKVQDLLEKKLHDQAAMRNTMLEELLVRTILGERLRLVEIRNLVSDPVHKITWEYRWEVIDG